MSVKDWIVTIGVIALIVERIIRWIFRFIRPEKEIDKLAMDMVKLGLKGDDWWSTPLARFYFYKRGLKKQARSPEDFVQYLEDKEKNINIKLENLERALTHGFAIMDEMEDILDDLEKKEKLPPELKDLREDVRIFTQKHWKAIDSRKTKIKEVATKIFRRLKRNKS
jgi:hypothetical protein